MSEAARSAFIRATAPVMLLAQLLREQKGDPKRAIAWAESLWEALCAAGYGPKEGPRAKGRPACAGRGPRVDPARDAVAALSPELAASFVRLWKAYGWPKGKQGAAERWGQLAPDAALAARIIAAAEREAREPRPEGTVRKYLQGWLSERRWEDQEESGEGQGPRAEEVTAKRLAVAELLGERKRLILHLRHVPEDAEARAELGRIDGALAAYGIKRVAPQSGPPTGGAPKGGPRALKELLTKGLPAQAGGRDASVAD